MSYFKCLFFFSSPDWEVMEIKRTDLSESSPLSDVYKWLVIRKRFGKVWPLDFKSMSKDERGEARTFEEGALEFNELRANFNFLGEEHQLIRQVPIDLSEQSLRLIH